MQLLSNRSDRFGNTAVRIGPTVLVDPFLQLVYGNSSHDVKGVRHIKIVRGENPATQCSIITSAISLLDVKFSRRFSENLRWSLQDLDPTPRAK